MTATAYLLLSAAAVRPPRKLAFLRSQLSTPA
jgi:hypothetical protein